MQDSQAAALDTASPEMAGAAPDTSGQAEADTSTQRGADTAVSGYSEMARDTISDMQHGDTSQISAPRDTTER